MSVLERTGGWSNWRLSWPRSILCSHLIRLRGEPWLPCIQRHAKKWQQNHSLQNFCTNWIFPIEGSTEADVLSHLQQLFNYIYIPLVMITAHTSVQHGCQMNFSMEWPKKMSQGANTGEFWFHWLKTKRKAFFN